MVSNKGKILFWSINFIKISFFIPNLNFFFSSLNFVKSFFFFFLIILFIYFSLETKIEMRKKKSII